MIISHKMIDAKKDVICSLEYQDRNKFCLYVTFVSKMIFVIDDIFC